VCQQAAQEVPLALRLLVPLHIAVKKKLSLMAQMVKISKVRMMISLTLKMEKLFPATTLTTPTSVSDKLE